MDTPEDFQGWEDVLYRATRAISDYSVALIFSGKQWGSGTLVEIAGQIGVLTAYHVIIEKKPNESLGITLEERVHDFRIEPDEMEIIHIGIPEDPSDLERLGWKGPDLSFVWLKSAARIATIKSKKSIYQVSLERYRRTGYDLRVASWFLSGTPHQKTERGDGCTILSPIIMGVHQLGPVVFIGEFDYVSLHVNCGVHDAPSKFGGVSGGGFWSVYFERDSEGKPSHRSPVFAGVAFWQTVEKESKCFIKGHGPKSIYDIAVREVMARFPAV
jgi:hypothetical protein